MSVDNSELLMLLGGKKKAKQTIGIAGQQGFGVGVYGGDPADLTAMGLAPMEGCENPNSENYGNYIHTNGSVMVFIPAFCYRIGNKGAPSYSRDAENALEIRDASEGEGDGWILHRAFIDGGVQKLGFFIDKYIVSMDKTGTLAVSVKNGDNIALLDNVYVGSSVMPNCKGLPSDAVTLGRARGEHYSCVTAFQWSAISMLSLAHGQAAADSQFCGWYDADHEKNYPKGNNNGSLADYKDTSVKWEPHGYLGRVGKTGSGSPFNKTTHNGQNSGVTDVNGSQGQVVIGWHFRDNGIFLLMQESLKAHDITNGNRRNTSLYDKTPVSYAYGKYWWGDNAFFTDASGTNRALCGICPRVIHSSTNKLFGNGSLSVYYDTDRVLLVGGGYNDYERAGVWERNSYYGDISGDYNYSFRISGYAN